MRTYGILAGLTAASIWGGMYVVSKVVLDIIPPFTLVSIRLILGIGCLALILALRGGFRADKRQMGEAIGVGFIGFGISIGLQFLGTKLSTAVNAALVTSASPIFMVLFGVWLLGERLQLERVVALVLATLGVIAVVDPGQALIGGVAFWGNMALFGAAVTWGLYSVLVKLVSQRLRVMEVSMYAFIGGLFVSIPLAGVEIMDIGLGEITTTVILGVLYLGLVSTALAMYLWNKSLALLEAGLVSVLFFAQPIVGVGLGAIFLGEPMGLAFWIGAFLISTGLIITTRSKSPLGNV
ncbi:MAG: DMT family transporter [Anaerolineaceae bacterium]|nr:MAG: DMT family transporter [Anaerolineaceae bacterium]